MKVALVSNVLSHYRVAGFKRLAAMNSGVGFFFLTRGMEHRRYVLAEDPGDLPKYFLRGCRFPHRPYDDLHLNDIRPILRGDYEALILGGWSEPTYLLLWAWGVASRRKVLFWIESTAEDYPRSAGKEACKRLLLRRAAACIVAGKRAQGYCGRLGVAGERIFTAPNATDREYFQRQAEKWLPLRQAFRADEALRGLVVLFVGRLVDGLKGTSVLLKACGRLGWMGKKASLLIVGDGPNARAYRDLARRENLEAQFMGWLDHENLCRFYALADVLVLPSRVEPWGFVLNEAMEFGLPLVASEAVGAAPDLVHHGRNGFQFPVGDEKALAHYLALLGEDGDLRSRMGQESRRIIENFSPENWAEGVMDALGAVRKDDRCA